MDITSSLIIGTSQKVRISLLVLLVGLSFHSRLSSQQPDSKSTANQKKVDVSKYPPYLLSAKVTVDGTVYYDGAWQPKKNHRELKKTTKELPATGKAKIELAFSTVVNQVRYQISTSPQQESLYPIKSRTGHASGSLWVGEFDLAAIRRNLSSASSLPLVIHAQKANGQQIDSTPASPVEPIDSKNGGTALFADYDIGPDMNHRIQLGSDCLPPLKQPKHFKLPKDYSITGNGNDTVQLQNHIGVVYVPPSSQLIVTSKDYKQHFHGSVAFEETAGNTPKKLTRSASWFGSQTGTFNHTYVNTGVSKKGRYLTMAVVGAREKFTFNVKYLNLTDAHFGFDTGKTDIVEFPLRKKLRCNLNWNSDDGLDRFQISHVQKGQTIQIKMDKVVAYDNGWHHGNNCYRNKMPKPHGTGSIGIQLKYVECVDGKLVEHFVGGPKKNADHSQGTQYNHVAKRTGTYWVDVLPGYADDMRYTIEANVLPALPDLKVTEFSIQLKRDFGRYWQAKAKIVNAGTRPTKKPFDIAIYSTIAPTIDTERIEKAPKWVQFPDTVIRRNETLNPGESFEVVWHASKVNGLAPKKLKISDFANFLAAEVDVNEAISESNENNNEKIVYRVGCKPCKSDEASTDLESTMWVEASDRPEAKPDYNKLFAHMNFAAATPKQKAYVVWCYIQIEAKRRAQFRNRTMAGTQFIEILANDFLHDYFTMPSKRILARQAIQQIGKSMYDGITKVELGWPLVVYGLHVPESVRADYPSVPAKLYPATEFFVFNNGTVVVVGENLKRLDVFDSPFLIGDVDKTKDGSEWVTGGKNYTTLMHWATGVKYWNLPQNAMREFFIGYEKWHQEGWDVFGEDAINDLIAEEQGRLFAKRLANGSIRTRQELISGFDEDFWKARAWVGEMIKVRQCELDNFILGEKLPRATYWQDGTKGLIAPWLLNQSKRGQKTVAKSLKEMFRENDPPFDTVMKSKYVEHLVQIYTLIYEAKGGLSEDTEKIVEGVYDDQFKKAWKEDEWDIKKR